MFNCEDKFNEIGICHPTGNLTLDGKIHRVKAGNDDKGEAGWYIGNVGSNNSGEQYFFVTLGNFKSNEKITYCNASDRKIKLSAADKKNMAAAQKKQDEETEKETKRLNEETASRCETAFNGYSTEGEHDYLISKKIDKLYGARTYFPPNGHKTLVIPMSDVNGKIWSTQEIYKNSEGRFEKKYSFGGKKSGNFHLIGSIENSEKIIICEGFSTGCSIHMATGYPVACAMDSGNLETVAREIFNKYPDLAIIVGGDNDSGNKENTGKISAEKAANSVCGSFVFPEDHDSDFNDIHAKHGLEAVSKYFTVINKLPARVVCLGYNENNYFLTSSDNLQICKLSAHELNSLAGLQRLQPNQYWEAKYPKVGGGINISEAASSLSSQCRKKGVYNDSNCRLGGVWVDEGRYIYHAGDKLFCGKESFDLASSKFKTDFFYPIAVRHPELSDAPMTKEECLEFRNQISRIRNWSTPSDARLFCAWSAVALIGGALDWRPHIWISGETGSGKSQIMNLLNRVILGSFKTAVGGSTTNAGIMQASKDSFPVTFDELEVDDMKSNEQVNMITKLGRITSTEGSAETKKGTAGQEGKTFKPRFSMAVGSIKINLNKDQDINRFHVFSLIRRNGDSKKVFDEVSDWMYKQEKTFAPKFFTRFFLNIDKMKESIRIIQSEMDELYPARTSQVYSSMIAADWLMVSDEIITRDQAAKSIGELVPGELLLEAQKEISTTDPVNALNYLMQTLVKCRIYDDRIQEDVTIGNLISYYFTGILNEEKNAIISIPNIESTLGNYEIFCREDGRVCISTKNKQLDKIFSESGSIWAGSWKNQLKKLDGARTDTIRIKSSSKPKYCIIIPKSAFLG